MLVVGRGGTTKYGGTVSGFTITSAEGPAEHAWLITVDGELDLSTADQLRDAGAAALESAGLTLLIIDLGGLDFIDSTGIGALVAIHNDATERGVELRLDDVPDVALRVLSITGLSEHFGVADPS